MPSLVGSEMCIRDRFCRERLLKWVSEKSLSGTNTSVVYQPILPQCWPPPAQCLSRSWERWLTIWLHFRNVTRCPMFRSMNFYQAQMPQIDTVLPLILVQACGLFMKASGQKFADTTYIMPKTRKCRSWCQWPDKQSCKIQPNSRLNSSAPGGYRHPNEQGTL